MAPTGARAGGRSGPAGGALRGAAQLHARTLLEGRRLLQALRDLLPHAGTGVLCTHTLRTSMIHPVHLKSIPHIHCTPLTPNGSEVLGVGASRVKGYLAHKKQPPALGAPKRPGHSPTVGP